MTLPQKHLQLILVLAPPMSTWILPGMKLLVPTGWPQTLFPNTLQKAP